MWLLSAGADSWRAWLTDPRPASLWLLLGGVAAMAFSGWWSGRSRESS